MAKDAKPAEEGRKPPQEKQETVDHHPGRRLAAVLGGAAASMLLKKGDHEEGDEEVATKNRQAQEERQGMPSGSRSSSRWNLHVNLVPGNRWPVSASGPVAGTRGCPHGKCHSKMMPKIRNNITCCSSGKNCCPKEGKEQLAEALG